MKIIANVGLNYNNFDTAKEYCDKVKKAGADIILFSITDIEKTWRRNPDNIYYRIQEMQLSHRQWEIIKLYCDSIGIEFLACPSTERKIDFLMSIRCEKLRINNDNLLNYADEYKAEILTQQNIYIDMSDEYDIDIALRLRKSKYAFYEKRVKIDNKCKDTNCINLDQFKKLIDHFKCVYENIKV